MKFKIRALNISFGYFIVEKPLIKKKTIPPPQQVVTFNFSKIRRKERKNNLNFRLENYLFQKKKIYLLI